MANEKMEYTITQEKVIDILIHAANRQDFADFKRDMKQEFSEFKHEIKEDIAKLNGRIDKLDSKLYKMMSFQLVIVLAILGVTLAPFLKNIFTG